MAKRAVVLLSGGLDSATVLAVARRDGFEIFAMTVQYGQRHSHELKAAQEVAQALGAAEHKVITIDLSAIGGSALTDDIDVPKSGVGEGIPVTYVPARNTVFLAAALGWAEVLGAQDIYVGVNAVDYSGYPDCRPEFIAAFEQLAQVATKAGVEGAKFTIHAPLLHLKKTEIIELGRSLGVDYSLTHSCYDPIDGKPCGCCDSCRIRGQAFDELGLQDSHAL